MIYRAKNTTAAKEASLVQITNAGLFRWSPILLVVNHSWSSYSIC